MVFRNRPRPTCERRCLQEAFWLLEAENEDRKAEFTKFDCIKLADSLTISEFAIEQGRWGEDASARVKSASAKAERSFGRLSLSC